VEDTMMSNENPDSAAASSRAGPDGGNSSMPWTDGTLSELRKAMLRFAFLQLRNHDVAEDVVQETLIAALTGQTQYEGRAAVKTWMFGILKNKIIDVLRDNWHKKRVDLMDVEGFDDDFDVLFKENERWQQSEMPSGWRDPQQAMENQQFWEVLEICMTRMPAATARVYSMREFLGLEVAEICKELDITSSNCWVILHRARMILRLCLQQRWFGERAP
jgi:RNA polymerase sigma-70 factor (ECF subfamily)